MSNNPCKINQVSNRNFLSIGGFKLVIDKCRKVDFLCNKANLPGITLGVANQSTWLRDIPVPGDKLQYNDFTIDFIVDENLENYHQIYEWMRALGYPETYDQLDQSRSDATLLILNSSFQTVGKVKFRDLFPTQLTGIPFDATITDQEYFTATVSFKYTMFDVINDDGAEV
jgi:hypothetical protein|tara:strand:- start:575 stop:1087 length:513 start_codon:yes stop_codon:yes gene_type:complete